jgi:hypothetical protein
MRYPRQGEQLVAQLPSPERAALVEELKRSPSPVAHALRVRLHVADEDGESQRNRDPTWSGDMAVNAYAKAIEGGSVGTDEIKQGSRNSLRRAGADSSLKQRPDHLYLEHVLAKLAGSMHDPNWQVQRTGLDAFAHTLCTPNFAIVSLREERVVMNRRHSTAV